MMRAENFLKCFDSGNITDFLRIIKVSSSLHYSQVLHFIKGLINGGLQRIFFFKEHATSEVKETWHPKPQDQGSIQQEMMDKKKQELTEESSLVGSIAATMNGKQGGRSVLYIIGDYLYHKSGTRKISDGSTVLYLKCSSYTRLCKGRANLDPNTLRVLKLPLLQSCTRDPHLKLIIQMENEMKILAETTSGNLKDIFKEICLKNPAVASKLDWPKMYAAMNNRRYKAIKRS